MPIYQYHHVKLKFLTSTFRSELRSIMNTVDSKLAESDIEDMIKEADINGDGKIDFDEFIKMMHHQQ